MGEGLGWAASAALQVIKEHPYMIGTSIIVVCACLAFLPIEGLACVQDTWALPVVLAVGVFALVIEILGGAWKAIRHLSVPIALRIRLNEMFSYMPVEDLAFIRDLYEAGGSKYVEPLDQRAVRLQSMGLVKIPSSFFVGPMLASLDLDLIKYLNRHAARAFARMQADGRKA